MTHTASPETIVRTRWCEVLGVEEALPEDGFFELGGHSLLAIELLQQIETDLGVEISVDVLFLDGSLSALLDAVHRATKP
ncbi:acyl carrier protein [Streptomyces sp. CHA1]|uniref:phosphopantetheine-binding protein n=1 Tax=Actinomycetes TaxID=1760 RepID=UPI0009982B60|nr:MULTISPECIES: phosphopantetheine-binding protein [Streptomyces]UYM22862.1 phosphopantetheine-binding protein [Streptomyces albus]WDV34177.1 phosphopantetheine-binding protein [Streptomyces sp. AD16]MBT3160435.1 acyl carrier protein [Streptomyces sp. G11C]MCO6704655.1 acyl carrier protein [Streptomyces sp. CHB9.2]MCO6710888.1 acyl carrier protein [Streptomyces sp. CHA3]